MHAPFRSASFCTLLAILLLEFLFPWSARADAPTNLRRFVMRNGKTFYASVESRTDTIATFKAANGVTHTIRLTEFSEPDQQFLRWWTKFKDELMNNAEFASVSIKELLELRGYQSFELDIKGNHIFVEAHVNNKAMTMMVDTGAQTTILNLEAAKQAKMEIGPMDQKIAGVAGTAPAAVVKVPSIKLGDVEVTNRKLITADLKEAGLNPEECGGLLGADIFREMDAVISYREGRIFLKPVTVAPPPNKKEEAKEKLAEFRRWTMTDGKSFVAALVNKNDKEAIFRIQNNPKPAPLALDRLVTADQDIVKAWSKLKDDLAKNREFTTMTVKELLELRKYQSFEYRLSQNSVLVDGTVGTTKATFLIDTGAGGAVFNLEFSQRAKLEVGPMDQEIRGIGGTAPAAITKVPIMQMGDAVIKDRELLSANLQKAGAGKISGRGQFDAIFGADFLRQLDAVISYKEGRIFLRPDNSDKPDAPAKPETEPAPPKAPTPPEKKV